MTKDDKEIISAVQQCLAERVGQDRFDVWFAVDAKLAVQGSQLWVWGAHPFALERIRKKFSADLELAAVTILGSSATVEYGVSAKPHRDTGSPDRTAPGFDATVGDILPQRSASPASDNMPSLSAPPPPSASLPSASVAPPAPRRLATLHGFVVGASNRLAHAAALSIAARPGQVSPLFLHGPTGSGKTHLLEGMVAALRQGGSRLRAVSLTAEQFTTYFLEALQGGGLPVFRRKYREVDLLALDDVQFFANKRATLAEVQHTLDTVSRAGKQVVLTADRPPRELSNLGSELTARMSAGLIVGLEPAGEEVRRGILERLAAQRPLELPRDVLDWMAASLPGDGRQLQGALHSLEVQSAAFGQPISLELAQAALGQRLAATQKAVQIVDIEEAICRVFAVQPADLRANTRTRRVTLPRMLAMWLARKHTRAALAEIGDHFGRQHSTVVAAQNSIERSRAAGERVMLPHGAHTLDETIRRVESQLRLG